MYPGAPVGLPEARIPPTAPTAISWIATWRFLPTASCSSAADRSRHSEQRSLHWIYATVLRDETKIGNVADRHHCA